MAVNIKRVYEPADEADGYRILVDRLWPRGLSKEKARVDEWLKEVGPSTDLRKWFGHDENRFAEFAERYTAELTANPAFEQLKTLAEAHPTTTLLYAAHDSEHNNAVVLRQLLSNND